MMMPSSRPTPTMRRCGRVGCMSRRSAIGLGVGAAAVASAASAEYASAQAQPAARAKPVLVFDVNDTLLDIDVLNTIFDRIFGVAGRMREWVAHLVLYSQSISLAGRDAPFGVLGVGVLRMLGAI